MRRYGMDICIWNCCCFALSALPLRYDQYSNVARTHRLVAMLVTNVTYLNIFDFIRYFFKYFMQVQPQREIRHYPHRSIPAIICILGKHLKKILCDLRMVASYVIPHSFWLPQPGGQRQARLFLLLEQLQPSRSIKRT